MPYKDPEVRRARSRARDAAKRGPALTDEELSEVRKRAWEKRPRLSEQDRATFVAALDGGATIRIAAGIARVPLPTIEGWLRRGREQLADWANAVEDLDESADPPELTLYAAFWLDCAEAIAKRDLKWLGALQTADKKTDDWGRYAWLLERTAPHEFGLRETPRKDPMLGGGQGRAAITISEGAALGAVAAILEAAGKSSGLPVLDQRQDGKDRPRRRLPAAGEILAESGDGERPADSLPGSP